MAGAISSPSTRRGPYYELDRYHDVRLSCD